MDINILLKRKLPWALLLCLISTCLESPTAMGTRLHATTGAPAMSRSNLAIDGGRMYETRLHPQTFAADLLARSLAEDGTFERDQLDDEGDIVMFKGDWRAQVTVDNQSQRSGGGSSNSRAIITSGSDGTDLVGRRFTWNHTHNGLTYADGANEDLKSLLDPSATDMEKEDESHEHPIVSWVRGDDKFEGVQLRDRDHALGNITHSAPQYVGPPFKVHDFNNNPDYGGFRKIYAARTPMVYVGGTMLHGFRADNGTEIFAYIPHAILDDLHRLASEKHPEMFLVDGTPTIDDAFGSFGLEQCNQSSGETSCWLSVLVSGLGRGGDAIFALNVTNPIADAETEETAASSLFLWEFTHTDLGQTTARPIIERLSDGTWVTILGNGQGTGKAKLFVLDIGTGEVIQELEVPSTSRGNGLSSPTGWDSDFDGDIDFVYAGDLEGNLWRFDFFDANALGGASISFLGDPLISITDPTTSHPLPITTPPVLSLNPDGGLLAYFGTGIDTQDAGASNGMFGIQDNAYALGIDPELDIHSVQNYVFEPSAADNDTKVYRVIVANNAAEAAVGWKLALPAGERILNDIVLSNRRVSLTSVDPASDVFGQNWLISLDFQTGGPPQVPFLDLNGDGMFDDRDQISDIGDNNENSGAIPIGQALGPGVVSGPTPANTANGRDILMVTRGAETKTMWPNAKSGLPDGSFDLDTFSAGGNGHQHTHRYDDIFNLNGVNLLTRDGHSSNPPNVEGATGILSRNQALLSNKNELENNIYIQVINPFSVDTPVLAASRGASGLDSSLAPPPVIYFQCGIGGRRYMLDAPSFNLLPKSDRTCPAGQLAELRVKLRSVNTLRATLPECVQANQPGPTLEDSTLGRNGSYRNGAITIQARHVGDNILFWEAVLYHNLKSIRVNNSTAADAFADSDPICERANEDLRTYPEAELSRADNAVGHGDAPGGELVIEHSSGTQLTEGINVRQSKPKHTDGRVSWREILD